MLRSNQASGPCALTPDPPALMDKATSLGKTTSLDKTTNCAAASGNPGRIKKDRSLGLRSFPAASPGEG